MPNKTALMTQAVDAIGATRQALAAALADGVIDRHEAAGLVLLTARAHVTMRRADLALRTGLSVIRHGRPPRDATVEEADLLALERAAAHTRTA